MLKKESCQYLSWLMGREYAKSTLRRYEGALKRFLSYTNDQGIPWKDIFTWDTLEAFRKERGGNFKLLAVRGFSRYLFEQNKIPRPINKPGHPLPQIYEEYLVDYEKTRQVQHPQILCARRTLSALNDYLEKRQINLTRIRIEQLDAFLAEYTAAFTPGAQQNHRSCLRSFLRYLWQRKVLKRDLASLLVGAPFWAQTKPPKFLRPKEVQGLFAGLKLSTPKELRTNAMVNLAFTMGLRPKEISSISLDDLFFREEIINLKDRKSQNPIKVPLPENAIKAIAAYMVGGRPKSGERGLFLKLRPPHEVISPVSVSKDIGLHMRKANLPGSAYWLRHTYAQNLLEGGASIFEVKEMLGHDRIQTTRRYLHIHVNMMRKVLFDEIL